MGEFILLGAQEQAAEQNVKAEGIIRDGQIIDEIIACCQELNPDYVVLGRPQEEGEDNLLTSERLNKISERITTACQAEVILSS